MFAAASQAGKKVLGCGSNVVDHIYNVKGELYTLKFSVTSSFGGMLDLMLSLIHI